MPDLECLRCHGEIEEGRARLGALFCLDCRGNSHSPELDLLRAECNRLASDRDRLKIERDDAIQARNEALRSAKNLLDHNRELSDSLRRALSPERSAA